MKCKDKSKKCEKVYGGWCSVKQPSGFVKSKAFCDKSVQSSESISGLLYRIYLGKLTANAGFPVSPALCLKTVEMGEVSAILPAPRFLEV